MNKKESIVSSELIASKIYLVRSVKVMLDRDLAELYGVETKQLKRAVKRNLDRFPPDFMFEFALDEYNTLRCQTGTLKRGVHSKYAPFAFTEQGAAMLSSVLYSKRAVHVNIQIMGVFTRLRQILLSNKDLKRELDELKQITDERFQVVFETLDQLLSVEEQPKRKIGFKAEEARAAYRGSRKGQKN